MTTEPDFEYRSAGRAISQRQQVETTAQIALSSMVPAFLADVQALAMELGALTPAQIDELWAEYVAGMEQRLSENERAVIAGTAVGVGAWLLLSSIPKHAYSTARAVQRTGATGQTLKEFLLYAFSPDSPIIVDEGAVFIPPDDLRPRSRPPASTPVPAGAAQPAPKGTWRAAIDIEARNAATRAYNEATLEQMRRNGDKFKFWLSRRDEFVRETHVLADSQMVPLGERFVVGNEMLLYPHDPAGSPAETAGCRCVIVAMSALQFPKGTSS